MGTVKFFVLLGPLHRRCEHLTTMGATRAFWHARPTFAASSCSAPFLGRRAPLTSSRAPFAASGCDARSSASAAQGRELLSKRGPRSSPMRLASPKHLHLQRRERLEPLPWHERHRYCSLGRRRRAGSMSRPPLRPQSPPRPSLPPCLPPPSHRRRLNSNEERDEQQRA